jgi:hypothetical protein
MSIAGGLGGQVKRDATVCNVRQTVMVTGAEPAVRGEGEENE